MLILISFLLSLSTTYAQDPCEEGFLNRLNDKQEALLINQSIMALERAIKTEGLPHGYNWNELPTADASKAKIPGLVIRSAKDRDTTIRIQREGSRIKMEIESQGQRLSQNLTYQEYLDFIQSAEKGHLISNLITKAESQLARIRTEQALGPALELKVALDFYQRPSLFHIYAAKNVASWIGGFKEIGILDSAAQKEFTTLVSAGDHIYTGSLQYSLMRFVVLNRDGDRLALVNLVDGKLYSTLASQLAKQGTFHWQRAETAQSAAASPDDRYAQFGYRPVSSNISSEKGRLEFYNSLRRGDELVFFHKQKNKWVHVVYTYEDVTVKRFQYVNEPEANYGNIPNFPWLFVPPTAFFAEIGEGTLHIRKGRRQDYNPKIDPDVYPKLSIGMLERMTEAAKARDALLNQMSQMGRDMGGMNEYGARVTQKRIENTFMEAQAIAMESTNKRRRKELDSIRAMHGESDQKPYRPGLLTYKFHEKDIFPIEPKLVGNDYLIDVFFTPGAPTTKKLHVREDGDDIVYSIPAENLLEARFLFSQILESAYGAILSARSLWSFRNIFDHRYEMQDVTDTDPKLKSKMDYYDGLFTNRDGQKVLEIRKHKKFDSNYPNFNLLAGLVWGHALRQPGN